MTAVESTGGPVYSPLMLVHELTTFECEEVLERTSLGRLACAKDGQPYVVPIHFSFDRARRCLYCFSTVGQKVLWMRENPRVCLEVDDIDDKNHWETVVIFGRYEEIHEDAAEADARHRAEALFQQRPEWWLPAAAKVASRERHAIVVYRIAIDRMTGRRATRQAAPPPETV
jgi:nitroimidazol reductase NimA-like FMN-containing flavoprotein (pyridoxamine 5'-phosphate oxidase superfamily)